MRKRSSATYIGVTGSSAKSTTTALIAHIISGFAPVRVQVTNNGYHAHIRALQTPPPNDGYFVGEIGAEGPGTLMPMLDLIKPTVGVVTLVRLEHKSAFRSLDAVMEEKGRLVEELPANGIAVLNYDDPRVASMAERTKARTVTFGQTGGDYILANVSCAAPELLFLTIEHRGQSFEIATRFTGVQHSVAVAAAFSCTHQLGIAPSVIVERLASFEPLLGRCSVHRVTNGPLLIVDTSKGAEHSLSIAFETIAKFAAPRKRIVLGQIADGAGSDRSYRRAYRAASAIADQVIFVGIHSHRSRASVDDVAKERFIRFDSVKQCGEFLKQTAIAGEIVLIKSSSHLHLERLMINFFASVRCWKDACGRRGGCVPLFGGGCGLYEAAFEQHEALKKQRAHYYLLHVSAESSLLRHYAAAKLSTTPHFSSPKGGKMPSLAELPARALSFARASRTKLACRFLVNGRSVERFTRWVLFVAARVKRALNSRITYIGVTGSCGKTTTTQLIGAILATDGKCWIKADLNFIRPFAKNIRNTRSMRFALVGPARCAHSYECSDLKSG